MQRLQRRSACKNSTRQAPRFFAPSRLTRVILGRHLYSRIPTESLTAEVCFGSKKHLHNSAKRRFICTGDLYPHVKPVDSFSGIQEIQQLLESDFDYRSTETYWERLRLLGSGHRQSFHSREFITVDDVDEYFRYLCNLIRSMQSHGCVSQRKLIDGHPGNIPVFSPRIRPEHDIGCAIGPAGEFWMFRTGHHRLHIAKQLGIANVPVEVHFVHLQWVARCLSQYSGNPVGAIIAGLDDLRRVPSHNTRLTPSYFSNLLKNI